MSRDELHRCWCSGITVGERWASVGELVQVCLIELVHGQWLTSDVQSRTERKRVAILVRETLAHVEASFLGKKTDAKVEHRFSEYLHN